jgi:cyclopropane-fatty-acyl-phospholipid synthase
MRRTIMICSRPFTASSWMKTANIRAPILPTHRPLSIGRSDGPGSTNAWVRKYIFPGGYSPALSEVLPAVEKALLYATDIEILRPNTTRRRSATGGPALPKNEPRRRLSTHQDHMVWQMQLARRPDAVPRTRDYMFAAEAPRL